MTKQTIWQTQQTPSLTQAQQLNRLINEAQAIVIGVGAGMSAATGFTYVGERFEKAFPDFIEKYHFLDMLQASLFEYPNWREYWAFQSRFVLMNYFNQPLGQAYAHLLSLLKDKTYHIITTNADNAFYAADYDMDKVFRIQGEYGLMQCSKHCQQVTYSDEALMNTMAESQHDMLVDESLIPLCPNCQQPLEVNKRNEERGMVEDAHFHEQKEKYQAFLDEHQEDKVLYLEIGVGHTTPQFIKHPFQEATRCNPSALYVTLNQKDYFIPFDIRDQSIRLDQDIDCLLQEADNE